MQSLNLHHPVFLSEMLYVQEKLETSYISGGSGGIKAEAERPTFNLTSCKVPIQLNDYKYSRYGRMDYFVHCYKKVTHDFFNHVFCRVYYDNLYYIAMSVTTCR